MSKIHELKTVQPYFDEVGNGRKNFEIRKDDREYKVGDYLRLLEYDPKTQTYSGRSFHTRITYILRNAPEFGLKEGYCILSIE